MLKRIFLFLTLLLSVSVAFAQLEVTKTIHFEFDKATLSDAEKVKLDSIVQMASQLSDYTIVLKGHTDGFGTNQYNDALAQVRNRVVKNYLLSRHIDSTRIKWEGFGERKPLIDNNSSTHRAQNRRVEVLLTGEMKGLEDRPQALNPVTEPPPTPKKRYTLIGSGGGTAGGGSAGAAVNVRLITDTDQMEAMGFSTMTSDGQALMSNIMVCWTPQGRGDSCKVLDEPIIIRVVAPAGRECNTRTAKLYDAVKDPVSGETVWTQVVRTYELVWEDGKEYWEIPIYNTCGPCINFDCPAPSKTEPVNLKAKGFSITQVSTLYTTANSRLLGKQVKLNNWTVTRLTESAGEDGIIKIKATDKGGKKYLIEVPVKDLKPNKKGIYKFKKKSLQLDEDRSNR